MKSKKFIELLYSGKLSKTEAIKFLDTLYRQAKKDYNTSSDEKSYYAGMILAYESIYDVIQRLEIKK